MTKGKVGLLICPQTPGIIPHLSISIQDKAWSRSTKARAGPVKVSQKWKKKKKKTGKTALVESRGSVRGPLVASK